MRFVPLAWTFALGTLVLAAPLAAQQSTVVSGAELDAALGARASAVDADRAAVQRVLEKPAVAAVAHQMGMDVNEAKSAAAALEGEQLTRAAALSADIEQALAGGATLTIPTTTIIIVLLLVIVVVLIAD